MIKSITLWIVLVLSVAAMFVICIHYTSNASYNDYSPGISEYSSMEQVDMTILSLETGMEGQDEYGAKIRYEHNIDTYEFIRDNEISYDDFKSDYHTAFLGTEYSADAVSYVSYMEEYCTFIICIAMIVCTAVTIAGDFNGAIYKNVFSTNKPRLSVLLRKTGAIAVFCAALTLLMLLLIIITSFQFGLPYAHLLCYVGGRLVSMSPLTYLFVTALLWIIYVFSLVVVLYGLGILFKNIVMSLIAPALVFGAGMYLSGLVTESRYLLTLFETNEGLFLGYYPVWTFAVRFFVLIFVAALIIFLAAHIYKKRQL